MLWLHLIIQCSPCFSFTSPIPAGLPKILLLSIWNPSQNHHHSKGVCGARWGAVKTTLHITNFEYKSWLKIYGNQLVTTNNSSMTVAAWSESFSTLLSSFQHRAGSGWDRDHRGAWACEEAVSGWRFSKMAWWLLGQKPFDKDVWGEKNQGFNKESETGGSIDSYCEQKEATVQGLVYLDAWFGHPANWWWNHRGSANSELQGWCWGEVIYHAHPLPFQENWHLCQESDWAWSSLLFSISNCSFCPDIPSKLIYQIWTDIKNPVKTQLFGECFSLDCALWC